MSEKIQGYLEIQNTADPYRSKHETKNRKKP